jgi:Arc/MetJ-type ribon-helix-helix transcriptional regulator
MASVPVTIKLDPQVKAKIDKLIDAGLYRHVSDFMHRAVKAELDREGRTADECFREQMMNALKNDPEVREVLVSALRTARAETP